MLRCDEPDPFVRPPALRAPGSPHRQEPFRLETRPMQFPSRVRKPSGRRRTRWRRRPPLPPTPPPPRPKAAAVAAARAAADQFLSLTPERRGTSCSAATRRVTGRRCSTCAARLEAELKTLGPPSSEIPQLTSQLEDAEKEEEKRCVAVDRLEAWGGSQACTACSAWRTTSTRRRCGGVPLPSQSWRGGTCGSGGSSLSAGLPKGVCTSPSTAAPRLSPSSQEARRRSCPSPSSSPLPPRCKHLPSTSLMKSTPLWTSPTSKRLQNSCRRCCPTNT